MAELLYTVSFTSTVNANSWKPHGLLYHSVNSQNNGDHASMNRPLASELSCTYDRNSSTSQPKSDHSFIDHGDSVGITEVSSSDKIGSYGDSNLNLGLDLTLWANHIDRKRTDCESSPLIAAGMEQARILTVKNIQVPAPNRQDSNINMYSDSGNTVNGVEEFNGSYHEAIASQPWLVQCSGSVTLKQYQQETRGIVWKEAKDLGFSSNTSRQSQSFATNHSGNASADARCNLSQENAGLLSSFDHNSPENQFIIVGASSATKDEVIGWHPIWGYRRNSLGSLPKTCGESQQGAMERSFVQSLRNSLSVKVNTDGMPIGRKVDLNGYESYENLARDLENMFPLTTQNHMGACIPMGNEHSMKPLSLLDPASDFVLTYEDGEADCMLAGDVPWNMFRHTVKRLRIMKISSTNAFAQKSSKKRKAT